MTRGTIMHTTTVADAPRRGPTMVPVNFVTNAGGLTTTPDSLRPKTAPGDDALDIAAGTTELTDRSQKLLDKMADLLLRERLTNAVIVGPADATGRADPAVDRNGRCTRPLIGRLGEGAQSHHSYRAGRLTCVLPIPSCSTRQRAA